MQLRILSFFYIFYVVKHAISLAIQNNNVTNSPKSSQNKSSLSSQLYTLINSQLNSTKLISKFSTEFKPMISSQLSSTPSEMESSLSSEGNSLTTSPISKNRLLTDRRQTYFYFSPQTEALILSRKNSVVSKISMASQLKSSTMQLKSSIKDVTWPTRSKRLLSAPIHIIPHLNRRNSDVNNEKGESKEVKEDVKEDNMWGPTTPKPSSVDENLYEPYWAHGEWVFGRTIKPYVKWLTKRIPGIITQKDDDQNTPTTTMATSTTTTKPNGTTTEKYINYQCQHPCSPIYESYGSVCAQKMIGTAYIIAPFANICDMIEANCVYHATARPYVNGVKQNYNGEWYVMNRGQCDIFKVNFKIPFNATQILERAEQYSTLDMYKYRPRL